MGRLLVGIDLVDKGFHLLSFAYLVVLSGFVVGGFVAGHF